jgi:hypothetical protein
MKMTWPPLQLEHTSDFSTAIMLMDFSCQLYDRYQWGAQWVRENNHKDLIMLRDDVLSIFNDVLVRRGLEPET